MVNVTPEGHGRQPSRIACPRCGVPVYRDHRRLRDRLVGMFHEVRRYHCKACGWQGLLAQPQAAPRSATHRPRSRTVWLVVGVLLTPLIVLGAAVYWIGEGEMPTSIAPGRLIAGTPLAPTESAAVNITLSGEARSECVWGGPGEAPFRGTLTAALAAARLPSEIVDKFEIMHAGHLVSDRLAISNAGIRSADGRRHFGHTAKAMTLGNTICFSTKINMPPDTITFADLYELIDDENQRFTMMIVARGGNVAVLEEQTER
jgi:hypothetical protein